MFKEHILNGILQWGSAIFAILAAALWLKSAIVKTPTSFGIYVIEPDEYTRPLGEPLGAKYGGYGYSPELDELGESLRKQSKWSAAAAVSAAVSAICQALAIVLQAVK